MIRLVMMDGCEKRTATSLSSLLSRLTGGSVILLDVSEYCRPRRVNREIFSNFLVNSDNCPERLTEPPTGCCVKSVSASTEESPRKLALSARCALLKSKLSPRNWYFEANTWKPRLTGRPIRYGSVNPKDTLFDRFPPESATLSDSP